MSVNIYTEGFRGHVDDDVLERFTILDNILASDKFLIGLSDQAYIKKIDSKYNVVTDLALGIQFYYKEKKPRKHKGEFQYFTSILSGIWHAEKCIAAHSKEALSDQATNNLTKKNDALQKDVRAFIQARIVELELAHYWATRKEFRRGGRGVTVEFALNILPEMIFTYYFNLCNFAVVAEFKELSLCEMIIEQLSIGGLPCGWLSETAYRDMTGIKSGVDFPSGTYPGMHLGVFADPTDKLAMLYLD